MLQQSTARNLMVLMIDAADHISGKAGLTLTITLSKNGAAFASISPTVTERGDGWYNLALTSSHTDTRGDLCLHITGSGADPRDIRETVGPVDASLIEILGSALAESSPAGNLAAAFSVLLDVDAPVLTCASVNQTGDNFTRLGTPAGASISADIAAKPTAIENADALLKRDWTAVTGEAARSVLNALRRLRNRNRLNAGVLTVYKEDGSTSAWSANVTTSSSAEPITEVSPT